FVLPRGSGGRTPMVTSVDLHVGFTSTISNEYRLEVVWDTFNVLNQKGVTDVDDEYTFDDVRPIVGRTYSDPQALVTAPGPPPRVRWTVSGSCRRTMSRVRPVPWSPCGWRTGAPRAPSAAAPLMPPAGRAGWLEPGGGTGACRPGVSE